MWPFSKPPTKPGHVATGIYKSRWGFHSVSYEDFVLLKAIRKLFFEEVRQAANWCRWKRKAPQNRISTKWEYDLVNAKVVFQRRAGGYERPEPTWRQLAVHMPGDSLKEDQRTHWIWDLPRDSRLEHILSDYEFARKPYSDPKDVPAIDMAKYRSYAVGVGILTSDV